MQEAETLRRVLAAEEALANSMRWRLSQMVDSPMLMLPQMVEDLVVEGLARTISLDWSSLVSFRPARLGVGWVASISFLLGESYHCSDLGPSMTQHACPSEQMSENTSPSTEVRCCQSGGLSATEIDSYHVATQSSFSPYPGRASLCQTSPASSGADGGQEAITLLHVR